MNSNKFASRHIGTSSSDLKAMLQQVGATSLDQLIDQTIPKDIRSPHPLRLPEAMSEQQYLSHFNSLAEQNILAKSYIGLGYNPSGILPVIQRNIFENPGWYTAYTPYQAEIAQGRLEALLNYQTMISELTGMPMANASLLDEGTSASEAMLMLWASRSREQQKNEVKKFFVSDQLFPQTIDVIKTRAIPQGIELIIGDVHKAKLDNTYFGLMLSYPNKYGVVEDFSAIADAAHENGIKVAVAADLLSLATLAPPSRLGADVVVGSTQRFGLPMGFGGPAAGYFACSEEFKRNLPGRIIGISIDKSGRRALRMALQTREQHIKREKATSNICTSSVLVAVMAGMYGVYHGEQGLKDIAYGIHSLAVTLEDALGKMGVKQKNKHYFDTLLIDVSGAGENVKHYAEAHNVNFLYVDESTVGVSLNELTTLADIQQIVSVIAQGMNIEAVEVDKISKKTKLPANLIRQGSFMTQEVFSKYHSETQMMRYIKMLERKDLSLNHSMIPLGSCTMKLNAASQMMPLSHPKWGDIHPFAPEEQTEGYRQLLGYLECFLSEITGMDATSLQPNSGASGEYAGLRVIQEYFRDKGESHRNICLIPASAHGTNPASAAMAGMEIVTIKSNEDGTIDVEDMRSQAEIHKDRLCCVMITYPSTYGIFESTVREIEDIIHKNGGQVYMDGANMNAQVGLTSPGFVGADVCHLNLHKTFAMPHGGGGPGVGSISVKEHLAPFLPGNPVIKAGGSKACTAVSSAPWGSAMMDEIPYAYILTLGAEGLTDATRYAILNANYLKSRLEKHFSVLYSGANDRAAHELIIDIRPIKEKYGITAGDISKRLMDYGFHAPTVSFPVHETLMVEPTESESKDELDRFADSLISIKAEIEAITDKSNNLLVNAPHPLHIITANDWDRPYSREQAAYPLPFVAENKFWPSVERVDDGYGDRNLTCCLID